MSGTSGTNTAGLLQGLDSRLAPLAQRLVLHFMVAKGSVLQRGSLEKTKSWHTDSRRGTLGKGWRSGWFGSYSRGSADTQELTLRSISLLRIGSSTFTDVAVPSTAFYELLTQGSSVGCVLSQDGSRMHFVANHSTGASAGHLPPWGAAAALRTWGWILAVVLGVWGLISVFGASLGGLALLALAALCLAAARIGSLAITRSRDVLDQAASLASRQ